MNGTMPFDRHRLPAAISPRLLAIGAAADDYRACPSGEMAGWGIAAMRGRSAFIKTAKLRGVDKKCEVEREG
ncbi:MAG: hypothetical protein J6S30_00710 [Kiritimatiellae bacterium]|nr:hypothetical protein [Kiritimatiellia bacterium]